MPTRANLPSNALPAVGQLLLAVDGGGSKTACILARLEADGELNILGRGLAGASNPRVIGTENAAEAIVASIEQAKSSARLSDVHCDHALLAIAGTFDSAQRSRLTERLEQSGIARRVAVIPDLFLLLPPAGSPGIALIAGTGSVGIGQDREGRIAIAGGWGPLLGDEGSGFAIGRAALRWSLARLEQGETLPRFELAVCDQLNCATAAEIKALLAQAEDPRRRVAELARVVFEHALRGNHFAIQIVQQAADDLCELVARLCDRLELSRDTLRLSLSGGLFQEGNLLQGFLVTELNRQGILCQPNLITDPTAVCLELLKQGELPDPSRIVP